MVGILYTNENMNKMKVSYINFWGKRKNYVTPIENVIPASELPSYRFSNIYLPLKIYSKSDSFKIFPTFGYISDFGMFDKIFGKNN